MITVKQLNQLRYLKLEITAERERLLSLMEKASSPMSGARLGSVGSTDKGKDTVGYYASEIAYLKQLISENMERCICELLRLEEFIRSIEDSEMRIIFRQRYAICTTRRYGRRIAMHRECSIA